MGLAPITTGHWPFSNHLNSWEFFSLWPDSSRVATIDRFHCIDTVQTFSGENPIRMVITSHIKCVLLGYFHMYIFGPVSLLIHKSFSKDYNS